jgi:hypothetical protein
MTVIFRISHAPAPAFHSRSSHACPMVIGDTMPETQHMADGNYYTSKRRFRDVTRAHGCVEVGNDPSMFRPKPKPKPDRKAIRESIGKAFSRAGLGS